MSWFMAFFFALGIIVLNIIQNIYEAHGSIKALFLPKRSTFISFLLFICPYLVSGIVILIILKIFGGAIVSFLMGQSLSSINNFSYGIAGFFFLFISSISLNTFVNRMRMKLGFKPVEESRIEKISMRYLRYLIIFAIVTGVAIFISVKLITPSVQSENQAVTVLQTKAKEADLKDYWTRIKCLDFRSSNQDKLYFSVSVYGKNGGVCGNEQITPLFDSFEIAKRDGTILWFDVNASNYVSFKEYAKKMKASKDE